jgi:hypothetical protein
MENNTPDWSRSGYRGIVVRENWCWTFGRDIFVSSWSTISPLRSAGMSKWGGIIMSSESTVCASASSVRLGAEWSKGVPAARSL